VTKRPLPVTAISCLLILAGAIGFAYHATEFRSLRPFPYGLAAIEVIRILAIVFGASMLRGSNWARWGAIGWIAFHVIVSALHSWQEFAMHAAITALFAIALFRADANAYFEDPSQKT